MLGVHPTGPYRHYPPAMADAAFQYPPLPRDTAKRLPWLRKVKAKFGRGPTMVVLSSMHWELARWVQVRTGLSSACASISSRITYTTGSTHVILQWEHLVDTHRGRCACAYRTNNHLPSSHATAPVLAAS